MNELPGVVSFLSEAAAYPDAVAGVKRIETHISWVFLTETHAYKLKKAVRFDFLDFSTPELRRQACDDEIRLNRRLAPEVYLEVLPITRASGGQFALGGSGAPVDWVVKMKRLPAEKTLDRLLADGRVGPREIEELSRTLAEFYRALAPLSLPPGEYRARFEAHVRANFSALLRACPENAASGPPEDFASLVWRVHGGQLRFLEFRAAVLEDRVRGGRIVEGHGDLRPEHVYLLPRPAVLDCIEFNLEYRQLDLLDELGFLAMECDRLGHAATGEAVLRRTSEALQDAYPPSLLAFYKTYRACVRGKVAALRGGQHSGASRAADLSEAERYLELAAREAVPLPGAFVVLVRGLSGSGKSSLASALSERLAARWLSTDLIRRELAAEFPADSPPDRYAPQQRAAVYQELFARGKTLLGAGAAIVLDGTFLGAELCRRAMALAEEFGLPFLAVECQCPDEVARERISQRLARKDSASEAFPELVSAQRESLEPLPSEALSIVATTTGDPDVVVRAILEKLAGRYETE